MFKKNHIMIFMIISAQFFIFLQSDAHFLIVINIIKLSSTRHLSVIKVHSNFFDSTRYLYFYFYSLNLLVGMDICQKTHYYDVVQKQM